MNNVHDVPVMFGNLEGLGCTGMGFLEETGSGGDCRSCPSGCITNQCLLKCLRRSESSCQGLYGEEKKEDPDDDSRFALQARDMMIQTLHINKKIASVDCP